MSEEKTKPVENAVPVEAKKFDANAAAASLQGDSSTLNQLLTVIMMREHRLAAKEEAAEKALQIRQAKRAENAKHSTEATLQQQAKCKHLKGGKRGPKAGVKDYAVSAHTFINQETTIKCHICGMKWKKEDTVEFLNRKGKQIKNHTRIGWAEAAAMCGQSTNTGTSSEIPLDATARVSRAGESLGGEEQVEYEM